MKKIRLILILVLAFSSVSFLGFKYYQYIQEVRRQQIFLEKKKAAWESLRQEMKSEVAGFQGVAGIVVKDLNMGWEISFNKDRKFASASLVKVPIMAAVFKAVREGRIKFSDTVVLKGSQKTSGSGALKNTPSGTVISVGKLVELMVTQSDNTATNIIINLLGFDYLNNYFKQAGLTNTNLSRKMMDFKHRKNGIENYTTPKDMASVLERIYMGKLLDASSSAECLNLLKRQKFNDRIPAKLPPQAEVAHKTGLERNVCHDVGIVFTQKGAFLVCVLTKHPSTSKLSKKFISRVALSAYNYYQ